MIKLIQGDCLEEMKNIESGSIDLICLLYAKGSSMRQIALKFNTNHKKISKLLKSKNVVTREPLNLRGKKKFKCDRTRDYNNMATHLRFDVTIKWLMQFKDFKKLKLLNEVITNRDNRWSMSTEWYTQYIKTFYFNPQFNSIYSQWVLSNYMRYKKPSIDYIVPKSRGGTNDIDNLQFLTWFENRCKNNMSQKEWLELKQNIGDYFINE